MAGGGFGLGIDFGTSNTVAVLRWPDGRAKPLLFDGSPLLPSAVYVDTDGGILTGRDAVHSARLHPDRFEPYPKRRLEEGTVWLGERELRSVDLVIAVLRRVAAEAQRVAGGPPAYVTVTHPAAWGQPRREALCGAVVAASLPTPRLAAEPVAAASYFVGTVGSPVPVGGCAVVYDFGAGTFDASVVRRAAGGGFEVLASEGLPDAGGLDVDAAIVAYLGDELGTRHPTQWRRLSNPDNENDRRAAFQLWEDARLAKEMLSRATSTFVHVPLIDESVPLGREQLEQLARPILDRTIASTRLAVSAAAVHPGQVAGFFLVGGSSRMPLAATLLHRAFGRAPLAIEQPELVVAEGALHIAPVGTAKAGPPGAPTSGAPGTAVPVSGAPISGAPISGAPISAAPAPPRPGTPAGPAAPRLPARPAAPRLPAGPAGHGAPAATRPAAGLPPARPAPAPPAPTRWMPMAAHGTPQPHGLRQPHGAPAPAGTGALKPGGRRGRRGLLAALAGGATLLLLLAAGGIALVLRDTGGSRPGPGAGGDERTCGLKIGFLGGLTGSNSTDGEAMRNAVTLAIEQYNAKHTDCTVGLAEFDTYDTGTRDYDRAGVQAQAIVADEKILGVVGPGYSSEADSALPVLDKAVVPTITPAATDSHLSGKGWQVFHRTLASDVRQADAAVRYLRGVMGASKPFVVADDTDFGTDVAAEFKQVLGKVVVGDAKIRRSQTDFSAPIEQIVASGADSVYFGGLHDDGGAFVKRLREARPNIKIVGGDRLFTDLFVEAAGKQAAEGVVITCPCVPPSKAGGNFGEQYKARFKTDSGYYGPEAYDAANVLLSGLDAGKATRADLLAHVKKYEGEGVSRRIKFTDRGELDVGNLQVWAYKVVDGQVTPDRVVAEG